MHWKIALIALALSACGAPTTGDDIDATAPGPDAAALDAAPPDADGLPRSAQCDPLADECATGLTCRIRPDPVMGSCEPIGPEPAGGDCTSGFSGDDSVCGADMGCRAAGVGAICAVLCSPADPGARCSPSQTCLDTGEWGPIGSCDPP